VTVNINIPSVGTKVLQDQRDVVVLHVVVSVAVLPGTGRHSYTVWKGNVLEEVTCRSVFRKIGARLLL
jgi:hypothetical protein